MLHNYVICCFAGNSKSLSVLHFGPEDLKQNYNYFDDKSAEQVGQPLLATVILYLSNVSQGGQILFPRSKVRDKLVLLL